MTGRGRPMKYAAFIKALDPETMYASASVVKTGEERGFFELNEFREEKESLTDARAKVRMAVNRLAAQRLPSREDGYISETGHQPLRAWYGWRWKGAIPEYFFEQNELEEIEKYRKSFRKRQNETANRAKFSFANIFSWRFFGKRAAVMVALLAATLLITGTLRTHYPEGVRIFREKGPGAALNYFISAENYKRNDAGAAFGKAWSRYTLGDFEGSEADCLNLIHGRFTPKVTVGNSYFLLGKIETATGRYDKAREHFGTALKIFEGLGRTANLFKTYCALTELAMELGDYAEADFFLAEAEDVNRVAGMNPGELFQLQAELAFRRGNLEQAIAYSYHQYEAFERVNHINEKANSLIGLAFYLIVNDQLEEGFQKTVDAQVLINQTGGQNKMYYAFLNLLMIRRCEGHGYGALESALVAHIQEKNDQRLQSLLEFALSLDCRSTGPEGTGEDNEDPPPNIQ